MVPARAGLIPISRAPVRFRAVARSAFPISVKSKNRNRLSGNVHAGYLDRHRRQRFGPDAFRPEEQQAKSDQREMQRDRDRQQQQNRCVRDRAEHDPVQQRRDRHDQEQRQHEPDRHRRIETHRQPDDPDDDQGQHEIAEDGLRHRAKLAGARQRDDFHRAGHARQHDNQPDRSRKLLGVERSQSERREGRDVAERNEDHPRHGEDQHGADRHQGVDRPGGYSVDRKDRCDICRHAVGRPSVLRLGFAQGS